MNKKYQYQPVKFFALVFGFTWLFWIAAAVIGQQDENSGVMLLLMIAGLFVPAVVALCTILFSKSKELKADLKGKLFDLSRFKPLTILGVVVLFIAIILISILLSTFWGQSLDQIAFVEDFSFSVGGVPTLLTLILTATLEEIGWRAYAEDALADSRSWWRATLIFGVLWAVWHLPLLFVPGTYQSGLLQENIWYVVNFFAGIPAMAFLFTLIYVKTNRSITSCILFHFFVNMMQEEIAMTALTKCVETGVIYFAVAILVLLNKELFFSKKHIGKLLSYKDE